MFEKHFFMAAGRLTSPFLQDTLSTISTREFHNQILIQEKEKEQENKWLSSEI